MPSGSGVAVSFNGAAGPSVSNSSFTFGTLNFTSGTSTMNGSGSLIAQVPSGTPTINIAGSGVNLYFYTTLNGTQGLAKTGSGMLTFRYSNVVQPFTGNITISAGTLGIQGDFSLGNSNNDLTIASGATLSEENSAGSGIYTLSPTRTITLAGNTAAISVISGETLVVPGVITDSPAGQPLVFNSSAAHSCWVARTLSAAARSSRREQ